MPKADRKTGWESACSSVETLCAKRGMRMTRSRRAIARLLSSTPGHPDAGELYHRLRRSDRSIPRATVYRTLTLFEEMNVIARRDFGDGRARYEPISEPEDRHHHLVDGESGDVIEFSDNGLEKLIARIAHELGFHLVEHRLRLFGRRITHDG